MSTLSQITDQSGELHLVQGMEPANTMPNGMESQKEKTLIDLVNELYQLERAKVDIEKAILEAKNKLTCQMIGMEQDEVIGTSGQRYKLSWGPGSYEYGPEVEPFLIAKGALSHFTKTRITKTGLDELFKKGTLTDGDIAYIQAHTEYQKGARIVKQVVSKEEEGGH